MHVAKEQYRKMKTSVFTPPNVTLFFVFLSIHDLTSSRLKPEVLCGSEEESVQSGPPRACW